MGTYEKTDWREIGIYSAKSDISLGERNVSVRPFFAYLSSLAHNHVVKARGGFADGAHQAKVALAGA